MLKPMLLLLSLIPMYSPAIPVSSPRPIKDQSIFEFFTRPTLEPVKAECPKDGSNCVPNYLFDVDVDEESVDQAKAWIDAWTQAGAKALIIEWNTHGGSVSSGFKLGQAIEDSEIPVHCVVDGGAYSMGFYLLQSCDTRTMTKRSSLMAHSPSVSGSISGHDVDFKNIAEMLRVAGDAMAEHAGARLRYGVAYYKNRTTNGAEWWFNCTDALFYNAIDGITDSMKNYLAYTKEHLEPHNVF